LATDCEHNKRGPEKGRRKKKEIGMKKMQNGVAAV
jgi:hypothetical protein